MWSKAKRNGSPSVLSDDPTGTRPVGSYATFIAQYGFESRRKVRIQIRLFEELVLTEYAGYVGLLGDMGWMDADR